MSDRSGSPPAAIRLVDVRFHWADRREFELIVPRLEIARSERVLLVGPSGSGKSTLLSLISGVIAPTAGKVEVIGTDLAQLPGRARDRFRADHLGVIFQMFNLIPYLSAVDNVLLPLRVSAERRRRLPPGVTGDQEARRLLARLGLDPETFARKKPPEMSVGQQQRVAAARALIGRPEVIVADEPTSSLDRDRQVAFLNLLSEEIGIAGSTLLLVSHDLSLASHLDRVIALRDIILPSATQIPPAGAQPC